MNAREEDWPDLDYGGWADTLATFRLWAQMVGKVRLAHEPWLNHSWHVPLYVSPRGLTTSLVRGRPSSFEIAIDLIDHRLAVLADDGRASTFQLVPMSVAAFHGHLREALADAGVDPVFDGRPNEIPDAVPFAEDEAHASYDASAAHRFWRALVAVDRVFGQFRTGFTGKASPVHLFWGSFDLAVTRFSGRRAPLHPGGIPALPDAVAREAYDQEVSSAGFWPGDPRHPEAAFYSYAYPTPEGFAEARVRPGGAVFSTELGEWLLPYEAVRSSGDPERTLSEFLEDTFQAAARSGGWDRSFECEPGRPGVLRLLRRET